MKFSLAEVLCFILECVFHGLTNPSKGKRKKKFHFEHSVRKLRAGNFTVEQGGGREQEGASLAYYVS